MKFSTGFLSLAALGFVALAPASAQNQAAGKVELSPHRAVYELKLTRARGTRSLEGIRGRILYDFSGSACEGYALSVRQVSELDSGEGRSAVTDLRATTWEEGDGKTFRFNSENRMDKKPPENVDGFAERRSKTVAVNLKKPQPKNFDMAENTVFPTEHMRRIIEAAREGKTIVELPVFDGSETGEKIFDTLTVIGKPLSPEQRKPTDAAAGNADLAALKRWPVTVSYFEKGAKTDEKAGGETLPTYSIQFELYENGVSRALVLDYNEFAITGEMTSLEIKAAKPCR